MLTVAVCVMMFIQGFVEIDPSHQGGDRVHIDMYTYATITIVRMFPIIV